MSLLADIGQAYRAPRAAMERQLSVVTEPRLLMFVVLFCVLSYVARLPEIAAISHLAEDDPDTRAARFGAMFVSTILMAPLLMYGVATLSHAILRLFGGRASWQEARLALFWAALVTVPLVLIGGVLKVFSPGSGILVATVLTAVVFFWQWVTCLAVVEFSRPAGEPA